MTDTRRFVLPMLDRQGIVLGLGWTQLVVMAIGGGATALLLAGQVPLVLAAAPLGFAAAIAYGRVRGRRIVDWVGPLRHACTMRRQREWKPEAGPWTGDTGDVPPCLTGVTVTDEPWSGLDRFAVVCDNPNGTAAALIRVAGTDFALLDEAEQETLLDGWGLGLAAHAAEGSAVTRICWSETANRTSLDDHLEWIAGRGQEVDSAHRQAYVDLVSAAGPETTRHDVVVAVVVSASKLRSQRRATGPRPERERLVDALRRATHITLRSLRAAGLGTTTVLDGPGAAQVMRSALDPSTALSVAARSGDLGDRLGVTGADRMGPFETYWSWDWFETDRCAHRSWWIEEWPRHAVDGAWLTDLLTQSNTTRRMTVVFEPVAPSASHKRIEREMTKLDSDALVRDEHGKRITASWHRTRDAVTEREEELVSGFAETDYAGIVTLSATTLEALDATTEQFEGAALSAGLLLRPLEGQHDLGWAAGLPLGLGLARTGWTE